MDEVNRGTTVRAEGITPTVKLPNRESLLGSLLSIFRTSRYITFVRSSCISLSRKSDTEHKIDGFPLFLWSRDDHGYG